MQRLDRKFPIRVRHCPATMTCDGIDNVWRKGIPAAKGLSTYGARSGLAKSGVVSPNDRTQRLRTLVPFPPRLPNLSGVRPAKSGPEPTALTNFKKPCSSNAGCSGTTLSELAFFNEPASGAKPNAPDAVLLNNILNTKLTYLGRPAPPELDTQPGNPTAKRIPFL